MANKKMKTVFCGSTCGKCRLESRRKKNRIPAAQLLATLACACACAPPPAVSRNKKVSQDKRKMASVSHSTTSNKKHDETDELVRTTYSIYFSCLLTILMRLFFKGESNVESVFSNIAFNLCCVGIEGPSIVDQQVEEVRPWHSWSYWPREAKGAQAYTND